MCILAYCLKTVPLTVCVVLWASVVSCVQAAVAKAKMKFKPLVDEEDERRRASAAAKLRALDEAIAKRKAEEERCVNSL